MAQLLPSQRDLFEIPDDVAYFNCASHSPQLRSVREAGDAAVARNSRPWEIGTREWFADGEELRSLFARLIGATADGIALIPSASYGLATAAANLTAERGERVIVIAEDFPSNVYAWRSFAARTGAEVVTVQRHPESTWTESVCAAIDERTRVVAVPNVQWSNGEYLDLERIAIAARTARAALVIDASQSAGAFPLSIGKIRPDYLVAVGYKWLLGPLGLSYMYVDEARRHGAPLEQNWISRLGSEDFSRLIEYTDEYQPGARRFDVGQRASFTLAPMSIAALRQLLDWGADNVGATLERITSEIVRRAKEIGLEPPTPHARGANILALTPPPNRLSAVASALAARKVFVSVRGKGLRISPYLHTTPSDIDRLIAAAAGAL